MAVLCICLSKVDALLRNFMTSGGTDDEYETKIQSGQGNLGTDLPHYWLRAVLVAHTQQNPDIPFKLLENLPAEIKIVHDRKFMVS